MPSLLEEESTGVGKSHSDKLNDRAVHDMDDANGMLNGANTDMTDMNSERESRAKTDTNVTSQSNSNSKLNNMTANMHTNMLTNMNTTIDDDIGSLPSFVYSPLPATHLLFRSLSGQLGTRSSYDHDHDHNLDQSKLEGDVYSEGALKPNTNFSSNMSDLSMFSPRNSEYYNQQLQAAEQVLQEAKNAQNSLSESAKRRSQAILEQKMFMPSSPYFSYEKAVSSSSSLSLSSSLSSSLSPSSLNADSQPSYQHPLGRKGPDEAGNTESSVPAHPAQQERLRSSINRGARDVHSTGDDNKSLDSPTDMAIDYMLTSQINMNEQAKQSFQLLHDQMSQLKQEQLSKQRLLEEEQLERQRRMSLHQQQLRQQMEEMLKLHQNNQNVQFASKETQMQMEANARKLEQEMARMHAEQLEKQKLMSLQFQEQQLQLQKQLESLFTKPAVQPQPQLSLEEQTEKQKQLQLQLQLQQMQLQQLQQLQQQHRSGSDANADSNQTATPSHPVIQAASASVSSALLSTSAISPVSAAPTAASSSLEAKYAGLSEIEIEILRLTEKVVTLQAKEYDKSSTDRERQVAAKQRQILTSRIASLQTGKASIERKAKEGGGGAVIPGSKKEAWLFPSAGNARRDKETDISPSTTATRKSINGSLSPGSKWWAGGLSKK
jgi:hypothetical protein